MRNTSSYVVFVFILVSCSYATHLLYGTISGPDSKKYQSSIADVSDTGVITPTSLGALSACRATSCSGNQALNALDIKNNILYTLQATAVLRTVSISRVNIKTGVYMPPIVFSPFGYNTDCKQAMKIQTMKYDSKRKALVLLQQGMTAADSVNVLNVYLEKNTTFYTPFFEIVETKLGPGLLEGQNGVYYLDDKSSILYRTDGDTIDSVYVTTGATAMKQISPNCNGTLEYLVQIEGAKPGDLYGLSSYYIATNNNRSNYFKLSVNTSTCNPASIKPGFNLLIDNPVPLQRNPGQVAFLNFPSSPIYVYDFVKQSLELVTSGSVSSLLG